MSKARLLSNINDTEQMDMFPSEIHPNANSASTTNKRDLLFTPQVLQRRMSTLKREGQRVAASAGSFTAFAFTLNYIFGAGVLSLPFTIAKAGVIGSAIFMVFTAFLSTVSMIWLVEVCGRAEGMTRYQEELELEQTSGSPVRTEFIADRPENQGVNLFRVSSRRLELNQLSTMILGYWPGVLYSISLCLYSLGSMWFYAVIFGRSLTETVPPSFLVQSGDHCDLSMELHLTSEECHHTYFFYLVVFLILTMFASLFELADQKKLQSGLSVLAMSCICIMITSLLVEAARHPYVVVTTGPSPAPSTNVSFADGSDDSLGYEPPVIGISIANFGGAFMNFVFAFMAHAGVPGLVQLMENKKQAPKTFAGAMSTACVIYLILGTSAALYFGLGPDGIKSLITLDWYNFNGNGDPHSTGNLFTKALSYTVRLYPCVSVSSAFVLYADTLASSMRVLFFENPDGQLVKVGSRWVIIWLSIAGAAFMIKIDVIVGVCGLFGVNLVMIFPSLLQLYSKKQCDALFDRSRTPYTGLFSSNFYAYFMLFFAVVTSGMGVYSLVQTIANSGGSGSGSGSGNVTMGM
jgi:amino acid permease